MFYITSDQTNHRPAATDHQAARLKIERVRRPLGRSSQEETGRFKEVVWVSATAAMLLDAKRE